MHVAIKQYNYNTFLNKYPELRDYSEELILSKKGNYYILPKLLKYNYPYKDLIYLTNKTDNYTTSNCINIEFKGVLKNYQKTAVNIVLSLYKTKGYIAGIIQGKPGSGKTVIAAYLSSALKLKTLIIVDNSKLVEQFTEAYSTFTNVNDIGYIKGNVFHKDRRITIAMVQSLTRKLTGKDNKEFYNKVTKEMYDLIIYDEAHISSSAVKYATSSLYFNTKNIIGLTATPPHNGAHKILIENTIGKTLVTMDNVGLTPTVHFVKYMSNLASGNCNFLTNLYESKEGYIRMLGSYSKLIAKDPTWLNIIIRIATMLYQEGHRTIIIVTTLKQIDTIVKALTNLRIPAKAFCSKQRTIDKTNDKLLVATHSYASAGFDYKELSALIQASPIKGRTSTIQTTGRILRDCPNKLPPVIYDLIDTRLNNIFTSFIDIKTNILLSEYPDAKFKIYNA